ncbi:hypothetical protein TNCV_4108381 [Trichonephila clavipes]|nr:hypothetical protein TNCV_4108381 [Trichonephila clavipes]
MRSVDLVPLFLNFVKARLRKLRIHDCSCHPNTLKFLQHLEDSSHVGITGNKEADSASHIAASMTERFSVPLPGLDATISVKAAWHLPV